LVQFGADMIFSHPRRTEIVREDMFRARMSPRWIETCHATAGCERVFRTRQ